MPLGISLILPVREFSFQVEDLASKWQQTLGADFVSIQYYDDDEFVQIMLAYEYVDFCTIFYSELFIFKSNSITVCFKNLKFVLNFFGLFSS